MGISPEGRPVDNVTASNRYDVNPRNPWLFIHLMNESRTTLVCGVYIPNTRERPDVVRWRGRIFEVVTTNIPIPQYREVMALDAVDAPPQPGETT